jgi:tRNA-Thr(GGU) m(6)t(6)A37 methyltransferase TsaA
MSASVQYTSIGVVHSPHKEPRGTPIQPSAALGIQGTVEILPQYVPGLQDLDGFSHIILIYHCHLCQGHRLKVKPFMDQIEHGVFATRAPARPNPIAVSVVRLICIQDNVLHIENVDIVDGTPLLDVKPYAPQFDVYRAECIGWLEQNVQKLPHIRDDARFTEGESD